MKSYILAVSGGPDSMAMLHMYTKKTKAVCVVNYNKRENSSIDVQKVIDYCELHNIKYYVHSVDKKIYELHTKENFQVLAREIRYNFFKKVCDLEKNSNLMVAHNLNDHLETAYMQFSRNSSALSYGIASKSAYLQLKITRPLLNLQKTTILRYCNQNAVSYAIDSTNELDIYERNKVRKVINAWNQTQLISFMAKLRQYNQKHLKEFKNVSKYYQKWSKSSFNRDKLLTFSSFYQYYLIYEFLKYSQERNNSSAKIKAIINFLISNKPHAKYRLEQQRFLSIINGFIVIK